MQKCDFQRGVGGFLSGYEILEDKAYDTQADTWSLGVIVYIVLGGYPPFILEPNQRGLFRKIRKGQCEFHDEYWGQVSAEAKTMISKLLTVNPAQRYDAPGSMANEWMICADDKKLESKTLVASLEQFKKFNTGRKIIASFKSSLGYGFKKNLL
jgi:calcium/calmodulin-dependent protein kinase I